MPKCRMYRGSEGIVVASFGLFKAVGSSLLKHRVASAFNIYLIIKTQGLFSSNKQNASIGWTRGPASSV